MTASDVNDRDILFNLATNEQESENVFYFGDSDDYIRTNSGHEVIFAHGGNDLIVNGISSGTQYIDGGIGFDTVFFNKCFSTQNLTVDISNPSKESHIGDFQDGSESTLINVERLIFKSGRGDDVLTGGKFDDQINGGGGNDLIAGGEGDDILSGASGDDIIQGGRGNDTLQGGSGRDTLFGGFGSDTMRGDDPGSVGSKDIFLIGQQTELGNFYHPRTVAPDTILDFDTSNGYRGDVLDLRGVIGDGLENKLDGLILRETNGDVLVSATDAEYSGEYYIPLVLVKNVIASELIDNILI